MSYCSFEMIKDDIVSVYDNEIEINSIIKKDHLSNVFYEEFKDFDDDISQIINFKSFKKMYSVFENNAYYMNYLKINSLPDKCFFIKTDEKIQCYICIVDMSPSEAITKISEKFYAGYLQCKSFFDAINETNINYTYYIFGYKELVEREVSGFHIFGDIQKILPGNDPDGYIFTDEEFKKMANYDSKCIRYFITNKQTSDLNTSLPFNFEFVQLDKVNLHSKLTASLTIP